MNAKQVASMVGVSPKVAARWIQRYEKTGGVNCSPKSGRKHVLTDDARNMAYNLLVEKKHGTAKDVAHALVRLDMCASPVHKMTIIRAARQVAKEEGTSPLQALRGKPKRELSERTTRLRVKFCKCHERRTWKTVMFTDRKRFFWSYPKHKVPTITWTKRGEKRLAHGVNHPRCVNVYGGLTYYRVTKLHIVTGTSNYKTRFKNGRGQDDKNITNGEYAVVLRDTLLPEGVRIFHKAGVPAWQFQQDNDPAHKDAQHTISQYMEEHGKRIDLLQNWPPSSPDLSPIENLWALVQKKLDARGCQSFTEFTEAVHEEWHACGSKHAHSLISSARRRIAACLSLDGNKTGY